DLLRIRQRLLEMGGIVEEMVGNAMRALLERDPDLAEDTIARDREVDALEKGIDDDCLRLLATQQPMAVDLRFLYAAMKIITDLERMGDSAKNIARASLAIQGQAPVPGAENLPRLSQLARQMIHDSLDAFVDRNPDFAREVHGRDDEIDTLYEETFTKLLAGTLEQPQRTTTALHLQLVALNLERVADHATNICEDVIYFVEATDIRHAHTRYGAGGGSHER
ncbi:MAG TPA: phosphate signaling complex protein PhoU, partial [Thermoanaerobaculia bacterium]|nr:phosphate signaling complex protein PhoU [Thermoanaerobaculia bacterium]